MNFAYPQVRLALPPGADLTALLIGAFSQMGKLGADPNLSVRAWDSAVARQLVRICFCQKKIILARLRC